MKKGTNMEEAVPLLVVLFQSWTPNPAEKQIYLEKYMRLDLDAVATSAHPILKKKDNRWRVGTGKHHTNMKTDKE